MDGWVGLVVALFILFSADKAAKETISPLLGQPPDPEFVHQIQDIVLSHQQILGVHDLVVHDYGPGRVMISLHAEVPAHGDIMEIHDVIDNIEKELSRQAALPGGDPHGPGGHRRRPSARCGAGGGAGEAGGSRHDHPRLPGGGRGTHTIPDLRRGAALFQQQDAAAQAAEKIRALVRTMDGSYFAVVTVEHSYTE